MYEIHSGFSYFWQRQVFQVTPKDAGDIFMTYDYKVRNIRKVSNADS